MDVGTSPMRTWLDGDSQPLAPELMEGHRAHARAQQQFWWHCTPHTMLDEQAWLLKMHKYFPGTKLPCISTLIKYESEMTPRTKD